MGRHAAGEGFFQGFCMSSGTDALYCYAEKQEHFDHFEKRAKQYSTSERTCHWIPWNRWHKLADVGCLFVPGPDFSELAWQRRSGDQRAFSLFGVTHTTASARVMDGLGQLLLAPLQPWDALVCTSRSVKAMVQRVVENYSEYLKEKFVLPKRPSPQVQLPVIPLGVNCAGFDPPQKEQANWRAQWRRKLQIADDDFVALYVGRLSFHAKAHPMPMYLGLELAANRTKSKVHLILSGWFANKAIEAEFLEGARTFCPSVTVHFVDGRPAQARQSIWYAADVFTSLADNIQETFGLTPIEGMAAGLPVVVSDWDGYKDTVRDGVDGFRVRTWIPPEGLAADLALAHAMGVMNYDHYIGYQSQFTSVDAEASALAYERLISNPALRGQMGDSGRQRARALFDWSVIVGEYQKLWEELAEIRQRAQESCPHADKNPANPLRDDPTALFGHYATGMLAPGTAVHPTERLTQEWLTRVQSLPMNTLGRELLCPAEELAELISNLSTGACLTVQDLTAEIPAQKSRARLYTLVWLSKMGMVRLEP